MQLRSPVLADKCSTHRTTFLLSSPSQTKLRVSATYGCLGPAAYSPFQICNVRESFLSAGWPFLDCSEVPPSPLTQQNHSTMKRCPFLCHSNGVSGTKELAWVAYPHLKAAICFLCFTVCSCAQFAGAAPSPASTLQQTPAHLAPQTEPGTSPQSPAPIEPFSQVQGGILEQRREAGPTVREKTTAAKILTLDVVSMLVSSCLLLVGLLVFGTRVIPLAVRGLAHWRASGLTSAE